MNRAYVQRRPDKLVCPSNTAAEGLTKLGYEVIWFNQEDADKLELSADTLVVGFIEVCRNALKKITGKEVPVYNYPDDLTGFLEREVGYGPLGSIRNDPESWPVFIKPKGEVKTFSGRVIRSPIDLIATKGMTDQEEVWVSEIVEFKSEFRCFVQHGKVIGCRHYKGDPLVFPNPKMIQKMVETWKSAPAAYCLDVGVFYGQSMEERAYEKKRASGIDYTEYMELIRWSYVQTALVEINDAHSAGDYGLDPLLYARFLEARWCELTGAKPIP